VGAGDVRGDPLEERERPIAFRATALAPIAVLARQIDDAEQLALDTRREPAPERLSPGLAPSDRERTRGKRTGGTSIFDHRSHGEVALDLSQVSI
jgi:hypothetical protein